MVSGTLSNPGCHQAKAKIVLFSRHQRSYRTASKSTSSILFLSFLYTEYQTPTIHYIKEWSIYSCLIQAVGREFHRLVKTSDSGWRKGIVWHLLLLYSQVKILSLSMGNSMVKCTTNSLRLLLGWSRVTVHALIRALRPFRHRTTTRER